MADHIFISYAREDQPYARKLAAELRQRGFVVWLDDRIDFGDRWWRAIVNAIQECAAFVVVMTPEAEESDWVEREIMLAQDEKKPILPLLLRGRRFALLINIQYNDVTGENLPPPKFYEALEEIAPRKHRESVDGKDESVPNGRSQYRLQPLLPNIKWIAGLGLLLVVLILVIVIVVINNRPDQSDMEATNQALMSTLEALASTSTAAAFQVRSNPLDQNAVRTATASARELATAQFNLPSPPPTKITPTPTPTPIASATPLPIITEMRPKDKAVMVLVPAGDFSMGSDESKTETGTDSDEKPQHTVFLEEYWIDRYEVTNSQYKQFVDERGHRVPFIDEVWASQYSWTNGTYPEGLADYPVVLVDWNDAGAYCEWANARLPTEAEWEKAARGTDGGSYPWGDAIATCDYSVIKESSLGCGTLAIWPVGSKPDGVSPFGAVDMAGNVWEWTSSLYKEYPYNQDDGRESPLVGIEKRVARGGSWDDKANHARSAYRLNIPPETRNISLGFRCVVSNTATPSPTPTKSAIFEPKPTGTTTVTPPFSPTATDSLSQEMIILRSPEPGQTIQSFEVDFEWVWTGVPLKEEQGFAIGVWREGQPPMGVHDSVLENQSEMAEYLGEEFEGFVYRARIDIERAPGVDGLGDYLWSVYLVNITPEYRELVISAEPEMFRLNVSPGEGNSEGEGGGSTKPPPDF